MPPRTPLEYRENGPTCPQQRVVWGAVQDPPGLRQGIGVPQYRVQLLARGLGPGIIYTGLSGSSLSLSGVMVPEVYSSQENQQKCDVWKCLKASKYREILRWFIQPLFRV
jgi:hypothetical protein